MSAAQPISFLLPRPAAPRQLALVPDRTLPAPWTASSVMTLALVRCNSCCGLGQRRARQGALVCGCVYRAVFRVCLGRYEEYSTREKYMSRVTLEMVPGSRGRGSSWGRKHEEYCADFELIARRVLSEFELRLFRMHFLEHRDWRYCTPRLKMDRGNFFHSVYRVEQKLGRAYSETKPYPLYPTNEYLNGVALGVRSCLEDYEGLRDVAPQAGPRRLS